MTTLIEECKQICCPTPLNRANVPSMVRLRLTFYNSSLFVNSELVPEEKQAATVAVASDSWIDFILNFFMSLAIIVTVVYFVPSVWSRYAQATETQKVAAEQIMLTDVPEATAEVESKAPEVNPLVHEVAAAYDLSMPEGKWLISEKAGIKSPLSAASPVDDEAGVSEIMENGGYIYPQFNNMGWKGKLTILAGHHYNMAISPEKAQTSFQNLKNLEVGDIVSVVDDYKVWNYEVYKIEQSDMITEANPDLLMYTCVYWWDSQLRLFVYARIVEA